MKANNGMNKLEGMEMTKTEIKEFKKKLKETLWQENHLKLPKQTFNLIWNKTITEEIWLDKIETHFNYLLTFYFEINRDICEINAYKKWKNNENRPF